MRNLFALGLLYYFQEGTEALTYMRGVAQQANRADVSALRAPALLIGALS